jgi:hypothetical protein
MSRLTWRRLLGAGVGVALWALAASAASADSPIEVESEYRADVVVTGLPRPVQLAMDAAGRLVILSHGWRGDAAAEIYRVDVTGLPLDASRAPRMVVPFAGSRQAAFGSLALDPRSGDLFMGEENGNRVYRLSAGRGLTLFGIGLNHLLGGSTLGFDRSGRLVVLDYMSPEVQQRSEMPPPPSFDGLADGAYHGPVVLRVDPQEEVPLPRHFDVVAPILPTGSGRPGGGEPLYRFISVAAGPSGGVVLLDSVGQLFVLTPDHALRPLTRLPAGHYHRTNMAVGPDGSVLVSSGFHIRQVFRVSPTGTVTVVARSLGDPEGIVVSDDGDIFVAENALHRVIRIRSSIRPPPASPR